MLDIKKENTKCFAAVMQSIEALHKAETEVENEKVLFAKFTDFLTKNADEIGKFHAVENEIVDFLQKFSFTGKIDFTPVRDKLSPLSPLRQKLMEMGSEAKKITGLPDRYNCHKAMEVCKQLTMFCLNEMKSTDYDKVTVALDKNIPKLQSIQKEFEKENQILADIKNLLQQHATVLNKFSAYKDELKQFIASFPNNRDSDLKTVQSHLTILSGIYDKIKDIDKTLTQVKKYADRYTKNAVVQQTENLISSAYSQMKFSDTSRIDTELKKAAANLKSVINAFDKENKDTTTLRDNFKKHAYNIWKEDSDQLVSELDNIIKQDTRKTGFLLQSFHSKIQTAESKKTQNIENIKRNYRWLQRKCYAADLNKLITNKYIAFSNFELQIENIRKGRGLFTKLIEFIFYN